MIEDSFITKIVERIAASKKYRPLYRKTIERVVLDCVKRYPAKEVEKKSKNLLHQIWGAYIPVRPGFKKILERFKRDTRTGKEIKETVLPLLQLQSSIKERIGILDNFYQRIFAVTGHPRIIIDWACGLNPLSWPWMRLPENCRYLGLDIDKEQNDFLNDVFEIAGRNNFRAELGDIFIDKIPRADVVFLLKLLPLLEHQKKGSGLETLRKLEAKWLVVSFPTKSLGGRSKNMVDFYSKQFQDLTRNQPWQIEKILFSTELVFVIKK